MFRIPGVPGKDLCDNHLGSSRRDILRVGGAGIMGLTLNNILRGQAMACLLKHSDAAHVPAGAEVWMECDSQIDKKTRQNH